MQNPKKTARRRKISNCIKITNHAGVGCFLVVKPTKIVLQQAGAGLYA